MHRRIKIRHLQAFTEIVRQNSMKEAAKRLFLTQPAISRTLSELEEILGAVLLTRDRGGIALTPQGEFFLTYAQTSLSALEQGLDGIEQAGREGAMQMRVGALPSVAARLMPEVVSEVARIAPELRLTIADGPHGHLTGMLRAGQLDLVIGRMGEPETMRDLSFTQLYLEEVVVVVRPGHPILDDPDLRRIADWPVIYPAPSAAIRPFVERLLIMHGVTLPPRRIETVSGAFGRVHTRRSDAIWFISAGVVAREVAEGVLVRLPIATELTQGPIGLMRRSDAADSVASQIFVQAVRRTLDVLGLVTPGGAADETAL
ncbi:pca operon transcription factor PcaQ [Paracoccus fistulariae]|uniref:Pca operon transcription factor PcaQ n=1 Tax=Paracoccus fistulariae TaxID=658446 RepID=A0ABY7SPK0_9RHOB|nr:pca operon transcription factor PcaQ [Paracoccus fistulariae]MDB6179868.1 pca operon transcription factor PcaQ [Paracoccus fistulariae]WCR07971.1 pca operon transcription factor PcaQ [Paracoccus fistulariae]